MKERTILVCHLHKRERFDEDGQPWTTQDAMHTLILKYEIERAHYHERECDRCEQRNHLEEAKFPIF